MFELAASAASAAAAPGAGRYGGALSAAPAAGSAALEPTDLAGGGGVLSDLCGSVSRFMSALVFSRMKGVLRL